MQCGANPPSAHNPQIDAVQNTTRPQVQVHSTLMSTAYVRSYQLMQLSIVGLYRYWYSAWNIGVTLKSTVGYGSLKVIG